MQVCRNSRRWLFSPCHSMNSKSRIRSTSGLYAKPNARWWSRGDKKPQNWLIEMACHFSQLLRRTETRDQRFSELDGSGYTSCNLVVKTDCRDMVELYTIFRKYIKFPKYLDSITSCPASHHHRPTSRETGAVSVFLVAVVELDSRGRCWTEDSAGDRVWFGKAVGRDSGGIED